MLTNEPIIPFVGTSSIKLYQNIDAVKSVLRSGSISFREEIWPANSEIVPDPWTVLIVDGLLRWPFAPGMLLWNKRKAA